MKVNFSNPFYLILIPFLIAFIIFLGYKMKISKIKKTILIIVRSIVVIMLILSISGISITQYADTTTTIFAVDLSASTKSSQNKVKEFLKSADLERSSDDITGVVCFGENSQVEQSPSTNGISVDFNSYINDKNTNIANALKLSLSVIPETTKKHIVLITDGNENIGDAISQVKTIKDTKIDIYSSAYEITDEVQLTKINVSEFINKGVEYEINLKIDSLVDTKTNVKLYKGNSVIANTTVDVRKGENNIVFSDISDVGGGIIYRGEIEPEIDTLTENNKSYAYCYVEDVPSILILQQNGSGEEIKKILDNSNVSVTLMESISAPSEMNYLNLYDCVIIADIPKSKFPQNFLENLESFVKTTGGGLIVTGGENSYALGEYFNTPLETILPVDMQLKTDSETPDLAMIMLIDRSGSMDSGEYGISRLELAKEAVIRSIYELKPEDTIGVIAFDDIATWSVDIQKVGENSEGIKNSVANIQPGGGTSILPSLEEAYATIRNVDAKLKHIILLTDGQAEKSGYDGVIENMRREGITLSTIAVGSGADTKLLERLAKQSGGRYYFSNEFTDLPQIFAKETILAGKEYLNNETFYPVEGDYSAIMGGIEAVSQLDGYIATTAKSRADVILKSEKDDPILAAWQYGIGRSVAWTSDMNGKWSSKWLSSDEGVEIFRNTVSWAMRKQTGMEDIEIDTIIKEESTELNLKMNYNSEIKNINASIISENNKTYNVDFETVAPGQYRGELDTNEEGAYITTLSIENKNGEVSLINTGFNLPYSKEYDITEIGKGDNLMKRLVSLTNGRIITSPKDVFIGEIDNVYMDKDISSIFIVISLIILLIDIAIRRFSFILEKMEYSIIKLYSKNEKSEKSVKEKLNDENKHNKKPEYSKSKKIENLKNSNKINTTNQLLNNKRKRDR